MQNYLTEKVKNIIKDMGSNEHITLDGYIEKWLL